MNKFIALASTISMIFGVGVKGCGSDSSASNSSSSTPINLFSTSTSYPSYSIDYSSSSSKKSSSSPAQSSGTYIEGNLKFEYTYYESTGAYYAVSAANKNISGTITIPATYNGLNVRWIRDFKNCTNITKIHIPYTTQDAYGDAFDGCSSLTAFEVDSNSTRFFTDQGILLMNTGSSKWVIKVPEGYPWNNISFDDSVTVVNDSAFAYHPTLKTVELSADTDYIFSKPFYQSAVTSLIFRGTKAQWNSSDFYRSADWANGAKFTYVQCSDGNVYI